MPDYSKWEHLKEYEEEEEEEEEWKLSEAELKARREKKRDELIQKELDGYKEIDEKLKRAEKLPARKAEEYTPATEPTSWSSGRETKRDPTEQARLAEAWQAVEAILSQLADDDDFQRDLCRPSFDTALKHWTNEARLPPSEAQRLFDEESFEYQQVLKPGLKKISRLQAASRAAGIGVPIDALRNRRRTVFEPKKKPKELTEAEKKQLEQEKRAKARKEFEDKIMSDIPPREPFSWKKLARQVAIQLVVMAGVMIYFHFVMRPNLEKQIREAELLQQQTDEVNATSFADDTGESEIAAEL